MECQQNKWWNKSFYIRGKVRIVLHDRGRLLKLGWVIMPPAQHLNIFQPELLLNAYTFLQTRHSSFLVTSSSGVVDTDLSLFPFIGRKVHQRAAPFIVFIVIIQAHTIIFIHGLCLMSMAGRLLPLVPFIHSTWRVKVWMKPGFIEIERSWTLPVKIWLKLTMFMNTHCSSI